MGKVEHQLSSDGHYTTPAGVHPPLFPGCCFYPWFIRLVYRYRVAVRNGSGHSDEYFSSRSLEIIRRLEHCGVRFVISGLDHIRSLDGPAVFVSNHMSTFETVGLPGIIHPIRPITFVVKKPLVRGFLFGPIMRSRDPVVVTRKNPRADLATVFREGKRRLDQGISIVLFPQGTRSRTFKREAFNSLGVKLARNSGVPIVPVALKTDCWSNGVLIRPMGRIHVKRSIRIAFAPSFHVNESQWDPQERIVTFIMEKLSEWGVRISSETG